MRVTKDSDFIPEERARIQEYSYYQSRRCGAVSGEARTLLASSAKKPRDRARILLYPGREN
jgi:hypothetical protein